MAKKSAIAKNEKRRRMVAKQAEKRAALKAIATDRSASPEEVFQASIKLAQLPRDGAKIRVRNRCGVTGRPRGFYRKFKLSRIALRDLASVGQAPGVVKSSW
ncbi:30S ribosomal protein S14 [Kiloniella sp. EL199]|uniref:30S ribosomal protein S14 n=1 Tax=Kiloniella sp. EL199 TaxID=2107581 RepID=UPI000EA349B2|nr:30S ribosomal protein S14 [Kiloniella sp. EL199]